MPNAPLLITACDVGTANFLAPVLPRLSVPWQAYAHPEAARVFKEHGIACIAVERQEWGELSALAASLVEKGKFAGVIAGTSWGLTLDKAMTVAACRAGVPSVAIVEHWSLYRERFSRVAEGRIIEADCFLPDCVWVNDDVALREGSEAGLPVARLRAVGQPHLEMCSKRLKEYMDVRRDDRIVFVSERLKDDFVAHSPLDPGFDEYTAVEGLVAALPEQAKLVVKLHPQEPAGKYDYLVQRGLDVEILGQAPLEALIARSGRIVGMFSMLLLEAALVRDDVVSFMPGGRPSDFVGNRIGATRCFTSADTLAAELARPSSGHAVRDFGDRFTGSTDRVAASMATFACA